MQLPSMKLPGAKNRVRETLFPVAGGSPVVVLIADSGETGAELPPTTSGTSKRQHKRRDDDLAEATERGTKDLAAALVAEGEMLCFLLLATHAFRSSLLRRVKSASLGPRVTSL